MTEPTISVDIPESTALKYLAVHGGLSTDRAEPGTPIVDHELALAIRDAVTDKADVQQLTEQRDAARNLAARLEAENARLTEHMKAAQNWMETVGLGSNPEVIYGANPRVVNIAVSDAEREARIRDLLLGPIRRR